ncbi:MAG: NAD(+) synthase, partial [Bacillota bacterium]|nr:NAD(+) synthase [Bacillota bacterium]
RFSREIAQATGSSRVLFSNPELDAEGKLHNRVFLAEKGELRPLSAAMAKSFVPNAYMDFIMELGGEAFSLSIDGQERRIAVLLGDFTEKELPESLISADLLIDLSQRPLFFDRDPTPPLALERDYIQVNGCGILNSGSACYLLPGGSRCYSYGRLDFVAPCFKPGLYSCFGSVELPEQDELLREGLVAGVSAFMKQINCGKAVIGLSGGIDSALAACIYSRALGPENVYLISMPTRYNSEKTKSLAEELAAALSCPFAVIPVEEDALRLREQIEKAEFSIAGLGREKLHLGDLAWENLMARERGRILAAASSALGGIFTCNGNKAELTVGYATFYGDLAGGFAAQADLWKHQVYAASRAFQQILPEAPMDRIAAIRPSAELSWKQAVDEGLGDPLLYDYHDHLLRYWVEKGGSILEALRAYDAAELEELLGCAPGLVKGYFPTREHFIEDLERWWKQYRGIGIAKRIQAPPLLALSSHPFGEALPQSQLPVLFDTAYLQCRERKCWRRS